MSEAATFGSLQEHLGYTFGDDGLLRMALTHRSWANEQGLESHYERVEFLGDAVLDLVVAHWLYEEFPTLAEGELSKLKSILVSEPVLARWAEDLQLGEALLLGVGEEKSGGRSKRSLLADAVEAILGAVFLDGGLDATREIIYGWLADAAAAEVSRVEVMNAKTALQELTQARGLDLPEYRHVHEEGPDHEKRFHVECWLEEHRIAEGVGASKKQAEQNAARSALEVLIRTPMTTAGDD